LLSLGFVPHVCLTGNAPFASAETFTWFFLKKIYLGIQPLTQFPDLDTEEKPQVER
jgi:hypothetical protein